MPMTRTQALRIMRRELEDARDPVTGELNMTYLAEAAANELQPQAVLDEHHPVWDWAFEFAEAHDGIR